jgi:hypothetical protein
LDAARRQLKVAIELWFGDDDPVSIHTLASAAHRVMGDLLCRRGGEDPFYKRIRPEHLREVIAKVNAPSNFFKHADEDPDEELEFNPLVNGYKLMHCVLALAALGEPMNDAEHAFFVRFALENPEIVKEGAIEELGVTHAIDWWRKLPRQEFLREFVRILEWRRTRSGGR